MAKHRRNFQFDTIPVCSRIGQKQNKTEIVGTEKPGADFALFN